LSTVYAYDPQQAGIGGSNFYLIVTSNAGGVTLNVPDLGGTNHAFNLSNDAARSLANALGHYLSTYADETLSPPTSIILTDAASGLTLQPSFISGLVASITINGSQIVFPFLNSDVQSFANSLSHYLVTWQ
jgi:hypothetical protein